MYDHDLVRAWKDPDERGCVPHPAGDVTLANLAGGAGPLDPLVDWLVSWLVGCDGRTQPL
jgi:hypothetical protein